jgi:hypothetical protein
MAMISTWFDREPLEVKAVRLNNDSVVLRITSEDTTTLHFADYKAMAKFANAVSRAVGELQEEPPEPDMDGVGEGEREERMDSYRRMK